MFTAFGLLFLWLALAEAGPIEDEILHRESIVQTLASKAEELFENRCGLIGDCGCHNSACQTAPEPDSVVCDRSIDSTLSGTCSCRGAMMDYSKSVVRLPSAVADGNLLNPTDRGVQESVCWSGLLDEEFKKLETANNDTDWQGLGTFDGMFRIFPGRAQSSCGGYDPRMRSWYAAATSGPKDVVIVLDVSGSMSGSRLVSAKASAKAVLKTLTLTDFVQVVSFSSDAEAYSSRLLQATQDNIKLLNGYVDSLTAVGATNYGAALAKTQSLLNTAWLEELSSNCHGAVLFMSDGVISAGDSIDQVITAFNTFKTSAPIPVTLFTYSLEVSTEGGIAMKKLACETDGIWQDIPDDSDLMSAMSGYYNYFALGIASKLNSSARLSAWVEPFVFASTGVFGTSVSAPVYDTSSTPPVLLGAVGTGIPLTHWLEIDSEEVILKRLVERVTCQTFQLEPCELEVLRERHQDGGMCGTGCTDTGSEPGTCEGTVYPDDLWCNVDDWTEPFGSRYCCPDCPPSSSSGLAPGAIAGIVIALVVVVAVLAVLFFSGAGKRALQRAKSSWRTRSWASTQQRVRSPRAVHHSPRSPVVRSPVVSPRMVPQPAPMPMQPIATQHPDAPPPYRI